MNTSHSLVIQRYDKINCTEFKKEKCRLPKEFDILRIQTFQYDKTIYILQKQRWLLKPKILGYAIVYNTNNLLQEEKELFAKANRIHIDTFMKHNGCYIEDFMIIRSHRRQGYATYFFKLLRQKFYENLDFLLCADGDGVDFWDKVGFVNMDEITATMILKAN